MHGFINFCLIISGYGHELAVCGSKFDLWLILIRAGACAHAHFFGVQVPKLFCCFI